MTEGTAVIGNPSGLQVGVSVDDNRVDVRAIDWAHEHIHDSASFVATYSNAVTNINEQSGLFWRCGAKEMHCVFTVQAAKNTTVYLYENPAPVAAGGTITPSSRNRVTLGTPTCSSYGTAAGKMCTYNEVQMAAGSITTTGLLDTYVLAGGEGPKSFGAQVSRDAQEWIFSGTANNYAVVMNAETADDDTHYIRMDWYEQD